MPSRIAPSSVAQGVPKRSAAIVATPDPAARPKLDDLIAAEPIAAPLPLPELDAAARDRLAAPLTARALKQIMTAFRGYEGMRWSLRGTLTDHRGLRASDAAALRSKPGIAAAFRLEIPIANPRSFTVTIHSPDLPTTRALLERVGEEVALEARVWVAEESETFGGFRWFRTSKGFPWTLVVTAVAARGEG
jgi:hypothetical protein